MMSTGDDISEKRRNGGSIEDVLVKEEEEINLSMLHELHAGRLVVDPEEARVEFGEAIASQLKLSADGTKVLWPQPTDSPLDPLNWSNRQKALQLFIITLASIVPDFDSGIGIVSVFNLARQYHTTTGVIINRSSNWGVFVVGFSGVVAVMVVRRYGRLPVLFWSQVIGLAFLIGATFAPNFKVFAAMRILSGFFSGAPQAAGIYVVTDMYPFHLVARKLNIWTMGFIASPFLSPFLFGFLVTRQSWRWAYGIGCLYSVLVVFLIVFFMKETMYDRNIEYTVSVPTNKFLRRIELLSGITGMKMAKYRMPWRQAIFSPLDVFWRPHVLGLLIFAGAASGFGIGINVTNVVFFGSPKPIGFHFSGNTISALYLTPIISILLGEVIGHFANDWIMNTSIRRNHGIFEAESRLWACYIALPFYVSGLIIIGVTFQHHLSVAAIIMGWGITVTSIMVYTVAIYAYLNDAFPKHKGEISALIGVSRTLGGFSVAYFQVPWAQKEGALQTYGVEAAIVTALFIVIPLIQIKGRVLREKFSM